VTSWLVKRASLFTGLLAATFTATADPWRFDPPRTVSEMHTGVYHHLDPAGRRGIAVSDGVVAIVWEDNRSGQPVAYVAFRKPSSPTFTIQRLSGSGEAYEAVVAGLPHGQFVFGWEEQGAIKIRTGTADRLGTVYTVSQGEASQVTLDTRAAEVNAAWSERSGAHSSIRFLRFQPDKLGQSLKPVAVTPPPAEDQLFPSVAALSDRTWVAWEDRSKGHTRILAAVTLDGQGFQPALRINRMRAGGRRQVEYGKGPGATRVVLAARMDRTAAAAWLDKRDFLGGYDVFTSVTELSGTEFGPIVPVQDEFGGNVGQWHAGLASRPDGLLVAVWDDDRDGSSDLQMSWRMADRWSPNLSIPGANGPGQDTSPVITFDAQGGLHLAWVERSEIDGPTRLRYMYGHPQTP